MISLGKLRVYRLLSSVPSYRRERLWTKALLALSFLFLAFLLAFFLPSFSALPEIGIVFFSVFYLFGLLFASGVFFPLRGGPLSRYALLPLVVAPALLFAFSLPEMLSLVAERTNCYVLLPSALLFLTGLFLLWQFLLSPLSFFLHPMEPRRPSDVAVLTLAGCHDEKTERKDGTDTFLSVVGFVLDGFFGSLFF